jgi:hypothetical protein
LANLKSKNGSVENKIDEIVFFLRNLETFTKNSIFLKLLMIIFDEYLHQPYESMAVALTD